VFALGQLTGWLQQLGLRRAPGRKQSLAGSRAAQRTSGWTLSGFAFTAIVLAPLFEENHFRGVAAVHGPASLARSGGVRLRQSIFGLAHLSPASSRALRSGWPWDG